MLPPEAPSLSAPVVALDVDGVLNPRRPQPGFVEHQVHVPAGLIESPFVQGWGRDQLTLTVRLNPDHGSWIRMLLERRVKVVWATTWQETANHLLAPLLEIPLLPVAVSTAIDYPRFEQIKTGDSPGWKAELLTAQYAGRSLIWIDDQAQSLPDESFAIVRTDPDVGLSAANIAAVELFVSRHHHFS